MDFKECIKKRIVKGVCSDGELIKSLLKTSKNKLYSGEKLGLDDITSTSKISLMYDSLRELLEALALKKGFKIYNHECYTSFLKEVVGLDAISEEFDDLRKIRNNINYYGKEISIKEAKQVLEQIKELRSKILNLILEN